ncbi:hypothetical protein [Limnohabitans sp. 63ED37-2]|jgi:hypothetical protein|uniref:hypothetical protein n=1 Tax=Limnohabitans sp. 63ED37-2 TaxID=1678128 RepID=UPI000706C5CD|nr:hypothetical protein [Limnohabitans sp. 63ED37-2]ALK90323.1 hypothetical protein L63ED372_03130 [Limnohabitans sp. 63ED37-2]
MKFREEIRNFKNERVNRIKTNVIVGAGFLALVLGAAMFYLSYVYGIRGFISVGSILIFIVFPVSLVYPIVRFFMGGKDSVVGVVISVVIEEHLKGKIKEKIRKIEK